MKNIATKSVLLTMSFLLVFTFFAPLSFAQELVWDEEKEIEELAAVLEFMYVEAAIYDESGNVVDFDFVKLQKEFGTSPELRELRKVVREMQREEMIAEKQTKKNNEVEFGEFTTFHHLNNTPNFDRCMSNKVRAEYQTALPIAVLTTFFNAIKHGNFITAASTLVKAGFKGSPVVIAATLTVLSYQCIREVGWR